VTTPVEVHIDPRFVANHGVSNPGNREFLIGPEVLEKQLPCTIQIRDDISRLTDAVHRLRAVRKQLVDRNDLLREDSKGEDLIKEARSLIEKLDALEAKLHNPKAEVTYDILAMKGGAQLYSKLVLLYEWCRVADGPPTQGLQEEYASQAKELRQLLAELDR